MLTEKQIIQKRKDYLKERRVLKRSIASKPKTFLAIKLREKSRLEILAITNKIELITDILKGNKIPYKPLKAIKGRYSIIGEMKQIKPHVIHLLKTEPDTRDDDNLLCFRVWERQGVIPNMKMQTFGKRLITKQYFQGDSITRVRRACQLKHKSLRGNLYEKRHHAEKEVSTQFKLF